MPDEERAAPALVVRRQRDELEDPLDVAVLEACLEQALGGAAADQALRARARVDPRRLDAHHAPRAGAGRGCDADQRDHLLRREPGHRRRAPDRPACRDARLCTERPLPLDDVSRDALGEHLDEQRVAEHDLLDRLVEQLGEAGHVDALLTAVEVDGALDLGRHHRLLVAAPDADRLLHAGDAGARQRQPDGG